MKTKTNLFEIATRERYRFPYHGLIGVEDLWGLPKTELNNIYKYLMGKRRENETDSLMDEMTSRANEALDNEIEIVKYIFQYKEEQENAKIREKEKAEKKQRILELMAKKQDDELAEKSIEDLEAMLKEL